MDSIVINGGQRLSGEIQISGAKNAALPLMVAALLAEGPSVIKNVPDLRDVHTLASLLRSLGADVDIDGHTCTIHVPSELKPFASYDIVKKMRASVYVLGPLLARFGTAKVSLPGGCAWGPRPVDLHLKGMEAIGAKIDIENGYIIANGILTGGRIAFDKISVGATGNVLMAAVLAKGETVMENCAIEPEITNLVDMLIAMGAKIDGRGSRTLTVQGVETLQPVQFETIPDRIEAGTYLAAAAMTHGDVTITHCEPAHLTAVIEKMKATGCTIELTATTVRIQGPEKLRSLDLTTKEFPGFPTDMQAQWMAMMTLGDGASLITDTIYHDRFTHAAELMRLGGNIHVENNTAMVRGADHLTGAPVMSTDLRASASLIIAGLAAKGTTTVSRVYHIDRGYEHIERKLAAVGADIKRVKETMEYDSV